MKFIQKPLTIFITTMLLLGSHLAQAEAVIDKEHQAVVETAYDYFNGLANGDQQLLASAFELEQGHMKMVTTDKETGKEIISSRTLKEFAKVFSKATKDTWTSKVLFVDVVDDKMAMVKLDFQTSKTIYTDYLVMYKLNGKWKIINKTATAEKK